MIIYLLLSIVLTTSLFVCFKLFDKFQINTFQAIVANYFTACVMGVLFSEEYLTVEYIVSSDWFVHGVWIGFLFILFFQIMALGSQKIGVSMATASNKMAIIIPVVFGILYYGDSYVWYKILGVVLALYSVYLMTKVERDDLSAVGNLKWILPLILFFGGGFLDTALDFIQRNYVPVSESSWFTTIIFITSGIFGLAYLIFQLITGRTKLHGKSIIAGLLLGIPNYGSIYFLLKTIGSGLLDVSVLFPILNIGGVVLASVIGTFVFKEPFKWINWTGVGVAVISIALIILEQII